MLGNFQTRLEAIVADPEQRISDLPLLTETERQQLLVEWNDTKTDHPTGSVHSSALRGAGGANARRHRRRVRSRAVDLSEN